MQKLSVNLEELENQVNSLLSKFGKGVCPFVRPSVRHAFSSSAKKGRSTLCCVSAGYYPGLFIDGHTYG